jgi:hypothetical protein
VSRARGCRHRQPSFAQRDPASVGLAVPGSMIVLNFHRSGKPRRQLADGEAEICVERQRFIEILDDAAACPFGAYDRRTLRALRHAGFKRVYASDGRARKLARMACRTQHRLSSGLRRVSRADAERLGWNRVARAQRQTVDQAVAVTGTYCDAGDSLIA